MEGLKQQDIGMEHNILKGQEQQFSLA